MRPKSTNSNTLNTRSLVRGATVPVVERLSSLYKYYNDLPNDEEYNTRNANVKSIIYSYSALI